MTVKQVIGHPIVVNLVVTFVASILAYKVIKYWESKSLTTKTTTQTPKSKTKVPVPQTVTTVENEQVQEVTN